MKSMNIRKILVMGMAVSALPFLVIAADISAPKREPKTEMRAESKEKREEILAEIRVKREAFRAAKDERLLALKKHFGEVRAERIEDYFNKMVGKFDAATDRLDSLAARLEKYLRKLEDRGKDVGEFNLMLADAKNKITDAKKELEEAKLKFGAMATGTDPKNDFNDVKMLIREVAEKVKEAHAGLVDVINSIKGSSDKATSTEQ